MTQADTKKVTPHDVPGLAGRMREDWNGRALEDARYFVAFGQRNQSDEDFSATANDVIRRIRRDFSWLAPNPVRSRRFLEIGCGPGRLIRILSEDCGEIHGVDISNEMVRLGREWVAGIPHAHLHVTADSDLRAFADDSFDLVYSYAVMQHLPDQILFWRYFHEAFRVLKPGGIFVVQFNGMGAGESSPDTWAGITVPAGEAAAACRAPRIRIRSLEGQNTQYVWMTAQKTDRDSGPTVQGLFDIDQVAGSAVKPGAIIAGGPHGYLSLAIRGLPDDLCDVSDLTVRIASSAAPITYIGCADSEGRRHIAALVPDDTPIGTMPLRLQWRNFVVSASLMVRVESQPEPAPHILAVTDAREIGLHNVVYCGWAKIWIADLLKPELCEVMVGGLPVSDAEFYCEDALVRRYQINIRIPNQVAAGQTDLTIRVGGVALTPVSISIHREKTE